MMESGTMRSATANRRGKLSSRRASQAIRTAALKGSKNLATLIMAALNEPVVVTQNGRRKTITKLEAMTTQLANKGASGESKATQLLLGMVQLFEDRGNVPEQTKVIEEADRQVMQLLFARIRQMGN